MTGCTTTAVKLRAAHIALAIALCLLPTVSANAQSLQDLLSGDSLPLAPTRPAEQPKLTASLKAVGENQVVAELQLDLPANSYTYSQNRSFSGRTDITVTSTNGLTTEDATFTATTPPKQEFSEAFEQQVEKHTGEVVWRATFTRKPDATLEDLRLSGTVNFQVCDDQSCRKFDSPFVAFVAGSDEPDVATVDADSEEVIGFGGGGAIEFGSSSDSDEVIEFGSSDPDETIEFGSSEVSPDPEPAPEPAVAQDALRYGFRLRPMRGEKPDPAFVQFEMFPKKAKPGKTVTFAVSIDLLDDWHTFDITAHETQISQPTEIALTEIRGLQPVTELHPVHAPEVEEVEGLDGVTERVFHDRAIWAQTFKVTDRQYGLAGKLRYQLCKQACLPLQSVPFAMGALQEESVIAAALPVEESAVSEVLAAEPSTDDGPVAAIAQKAAKGEADAASLPVYLLLAFAGGLLLNIMPCVLPVLAIKILSFVQQAGENRGRILALNVAYSVGVIGIFLILATLAVTLGMGWGGLFQQPVFTLVMSAVIFAMALSLLGVYEIPVPGLLGSASGGGHHQEGLHGAFTTGIVATLLATPCSGPFMGTTLAWSVRQPAAVVFLVWGTMGLGMASPYLVIGLFPRLVNFLPKPGMWMVRFKEFAGFVLLGTVIFLLVSLPAETHLGVLVVMLGIGLALWMVGNLYEHSSDAGKKWAVRLSSLMLLVTIGSLGMYFYNRGEVLAEQKQRKFDEAVRLAERALEGGASAEDREAFDAIFVSNHEGELPWVPFSEQRLSKLLEENRPVLIDFTADWCAICKTNERVALNTEKTAQFVQQHGVVPLYADFTREDPEIQRWLNRFGSISVPLTVIVPPGNGEPIRLDGPYSQEMLLEKLRQAVDSRTATLAPASPAE